MKAGLLSSVVAALSVVAIASAAEARPTVWQSTRSTRTFAESEALDEVDHISAEAEKHHKEPSPLSLKTEEEALDGAGGRSSTNPTVLLALAEVLQRLEDYQGSVPLLEATLASAASDGQRSQAFFDLAIVAAHAHDAKTEIPLYEASLACDATFASDYREPMTRGETLANEAEAYMLTGDVARAVAGYRAAIASVSAYELPSMTTTFWSLGVALDRSGDLDGGLEQLAIAKKYDPDDKRITGDGWFFEPPYDADWYFGLEALLLARGSEGDPVLEALHYASARDHFASFVANASPDDPYIARARSRLQDIQREVTARFKAPIGPKITPLPSPGATGGN